MNPARGEPMVPSAHHLSQGSENPKHSAGVESHPNVAKSATLGWGTRLAKQFPLVRILERRTRLSEIRDVVT